MIIDENKIKEYVNYHDWVNCPNEWHELWNTSASVRGILLENITNEETGKDTTTETDSWTIRSKLKSMLPTVGRTKFRTEFALRP